MSTIVFIIAAIHVFLAIFGLFKIPRQYFFKSYFVQFAFISSIWVIANFIQIYSQSYFWLRTSYALGALMISSSLLMTISFSLQRRLPLGVDWIITIPGLVFFALNYVPNLFFQERQLTPANFKTLSGVFTPLFTLYNVYLFGAVFFMILKMFSCAKAFTGIRKKQALAIFYGMVLMGSWSLVFSFILPLLGITQFINLDICSSLFFVGFVTYAIFRYQFMNIPFIFRRSTLYGVMIAFITGIYLASILLFEYLFQNLFRYRYNSIIARLMAAIVIAFTFLPLRNRVERFINRAFFRTSHEYANTLIRFSEKLLTILDLRDLLGTIVDNVSQLLQVECAALLIREKKSSDYRVKSLVGLENEARDVSFLDSDPLIQWLRNRLHEHDQIAIRSALGEEAPQQGKTLLSQMDSLKAELCLPLFFGDKLIAFLAIGDKKDGERFISDDLRMLRAVANHAATALANSFTFDDLKKSYLGTIEALAKAIEAKDEYTRGHSERVVSIATEIAKEMDLSREEIDILRNAGMLHDIGKIAISDDILKKPASLNQAEQELMMKHPVVGDNIIASIDFLQDVRTIIRHHHERWDGKGYPSGLQKDAIPKLSRILCIADTFDAITSRRSYRPPLSHQVALEELKQNSGRQFDPQIVEFFFSAYHKGNIQ